MASETIYITGKSHWAKLFPYNKDKNEDFHGPGGAYTVDLEVDQEELGKFVASGARTTPRVLEDMTTIKLKRKHTHNTIPEFGGPPQVVDADKNTWDGSLVGNGSELECAITIYDTKMGKGVRLEGVRVIEHVELPPLEGAEAGQKKLPF